MKLTATLSNDHRVIEQVLRCLSEMASRASASGIVDVDSADSALRFLRNFADKCHHKKEEDVLFPALARVGFTPEGGPVAVMLEEHEVGRTYLGRIESGIQQARLGAKGATEAFVAAVRAYVDLLTAHIAKEDNILFPLADHALGGAGGAAVLAGFESAEASLDHGRLHAEMLAIADALGNRFGVARATAPEPFRGCCHTSGAH
jgi:hemerythrin-like domain-containing protein